MSRGGRAKQERLQHVPLFAGLPDRELDSLARIADEVHVTAGTRIIGRGGVGHEFFVVEEGTASVRDGDTELVKIGPGGHFGELALLGEPIRSADVVAVTDMDLVVIGTPQFLSLLEDVPTVTRAILRTLARRLQEQSQLR